MCKATHGSTGNLPGVTPLRKTDFIPSSSHQLQIAKSCGWVGPHEPFPFPGWNFDWLDFVPATSASVRNAVQQPCHVFMTVFWERQSRDVFSFIRQLTTASNFSSSWCKSLLRASWTPSLICTWFHTEYACRHRTDKHKIRKLTGDNLESKLTGTCGPFSLITEITLSLEPLTSTARAFDWVYSTRHVFLRVERASDLTRKPLFTP